METMIRCLGLLDRTGALQRAVLGLPEEIDLVEYERVADLEGSGEPVDVLLVGARELSAAGLRRVGRWKSANPASLVVAHTPEGQPGADLLKAAGIGLRVRGPLTLRKLEQVLGRADGELHRLAVASGRLHLEEDGPAQQDAAELEDPALEDLALDEAGGEFDGVEEPGPAWTAGPAAGGQLITVASATGGCGKTFFATNAAALLARSGHKVLLVDLDLQFGEVASALQIQHGFSLYDGLYTAKGQRLSADDFTASLGELTAHHPLGFDVLTAPRDPMLADYISARDARTVLDAVRPHYDIVIADTPPSLNDVVIAALDRSSLVVVLASLDVPSLRNLQAFLDILTRLNLRSEVVKLLMNKADKDVGVTVSQAQEAFDQRFDGVIPLDRAVSRSINLGTTVVTLEPRARVSRALVPAVQALLGQLLPAPAGFEQPAQPAPVHTSAVLGVLRRIRQGGNA